MEDGEFTGLWFNPDTSYLFKESTYSNGNNLISKATDDQWTHEALYYTKSKRWILNRWSQWQGSVETYNLISEQEAVDWFIKNEYTDEKLDNLPKRVKERVLKQISEQEI